MNPQNPNVYVMKMVSNLIEGPLNAFEILLKYRQHLLIISPEIFSSDQVFSDRFFDIIYNDSENYHRLREDILEEISRVGSYADFQLIDYSFFIIEQHRKNPSELPRYCLGIHAFIAQDPCFIEMMSINIESSGISIPSCLDDLNESELKDFNERFQNLVPLDLENISYLSTIIFHQNTDNQEQITTIHQSENIPAIQNSSNEYRYPYSYHESYSDNDTYLYPYHYPYTYSYNYAYPYLYPYSYSYSYQYSYQYLYPYSYPYNYVYGYTYPYNYLYPYIYPYNYQYNYPYNDDNVYPYLYPYSYSYTYPYHYPYTYPYNYTYPYLYPYTYNYSYPYDYPYLYPYIYPYNYSYNYPYTYSYNYPYSYPNHYSYPYSYNYPYHYENNYSYGYAYTYRYNYPYNYSYNYSYNYPYTYSYPYRAIQESTESTENTTTNRDALFKNNNQMLLTDFNRKKLTFTEPFEEKALKEQEENQNLNSFSKKY